MNEEIEKYDDNFNVSEYLVSVGGTEVSRQYGYDRLNRINSVELNSGLAQMYEYDVVSNLKKQRMPLYGADTDVLYNQATQLPESGTNASGGSFGILRHDVRGNLTRIGQSNPRFDNASRLRGIIGGGGSVDARYTYDAHGYRVLSDRAEKNERIVTIYNRAGILLHSMNIDDGTTSDYIYSGRYLIARTDHSEGGAND